MGTREDHDRASGSGASAFFGDDRAEPLDDGDALEAAAPALSRKLEAAATRFDEERARSRGVLDALPYGVAETSARGVVRVANARLATMLGVPLRLLLDKPLVHFVARADCRAFRVWLEATALAGRGEPFVVHMRPRHGGAPFPVEVSARRSLAARALVWSLRPWLEPAAECPRATTSLSALVLATADAVRAVARGKKIVMKENVASEVTIDGGRAPRVWAALGDAARGALRLAEEGEVFRVSAHDTSDGVAVVVFGAVSLRVG